MVQRRARMFLHDWSVPGMTESLYKFFQAEHVTGKRPLSLC
jgi:hypothetical protein